MGLRNVKSRQVVGRVELPHVVSQFVSKHNFVRFRRIPTQVPADSKEKMRRDQHPPLHVRLEVQSEVEWCRAFQVLADHRETDVVDTGLLQIPLVERGLDSPRPIVRTTPLGQTEDRGMELLERPAPACTMVLQAATVPKSVQHTAERPKALGNPGIPGDLHEEHQVLLVRAGVWDWNAKGELPCLERVTHAVPQGLEV
jgi:hypothetical protein